MLMRKISVDDKVHKLPNDTARLLFTWLIPNLDVNGCFYADPALVKSLVFPRRVDISVEQVSTYLTEMARLQLIIKYSKNGDTYLFAPGFKKNQTNLREDREGDSGIPPFGSNDGLTPELVRSNGGLTHAQDKVRQDKVRLREDNIYSVWNEQKLITHKKLTDDIERAINTALKDNTEQEIIQAIKNYAEIQKSELYYFKYIWTLKEFLKRGLSKFLDGDIARKNYLKDKDNGTYKNRPGQTPRRNQYTKPEELLERAE